MLIRIAVLSFALCIVTGCSKPIATSPTEDPTSAAKSQALRLNAATSAQAQTVASDRENQLVNWGYNDGYEAGTRGFASNPSIGIDFYKLTDPAEQKIYTDAYNNGYAQGSTGQPSPSPSPSPTGSISPDRRAELQRRGRENGLSDAQSGFAANPGQGITALGLTDPTEIRVYTNAYNNGYQRQPSPSPSPVPTVSPGRLTQLRQQGYNDGYNDAQTNFPQDPNRGITLLGLVDNAERRTYTNGYNNGYQTYINSQQPPPASLW